MSYEVVALATGFVTAVGAAAAQIIREIKLGSPPQVTPPVPDKDPEGA